jgi:hypothetical protein
VSNYKISPMYNQAKGNRNSGHDNTKIISLDSFLN